MSLLEGFMYVSFPYCLQKNEGCQVLEKELIFVSKEVHP